MMADKKNNIPLWGAVVASTVYVFVGLIRSALVLILVFPPPDIFQMVLLCFAMKSAKKKKKIMFLVL